MLQWMGGSRRKVTTYFEQRKRRQQQHTAGFESYADEKPSCTLHCENNRSLDILSLVNVSTVAQEQKISRLNEAKDNSEEDRFILEHQSRCPFPAILTNERILVDPSETNQRTSSSCGTEAEYPNKDFSDFKGHLRTTAFYRVSTGPPVHNEDSVRNSNKLDPFKLSNMHLGLIESGYKLNPFKLSTMHYISVIDLLGDGGTNISAEEDSVHAQEAHVAFSVEGLGKVETETPVHSPRIPDRSFPNGSFPPKRSRRQPSTSKHLEYGFHDPDSRLTHTSTGKLNDVLMQGIDFSVDESSVEEPFCSGDVMNVVGDPNHQFLNFRNSGNSSPFIWKDNALESDFGNDELIYNIGDSGRNILNGIG
ncbi:hypothetical protein CDL12_06481 [Handroanthus impetiginosus]|uniref:Uncharacterized protein n=1 Tax=Handroanthus impetiginosus TaxID=429701 RepID=A0A2G9HTH5_9LAMI|nr:hypothetical protein CDL12_06481 [Handroanthus impetiginosus]